MNPFWWRALLVITLITLGNFLENLFSVTFIVSTMLYLLVVAWALILPFQKALPFSFLVLFLLDILPDGVPGAFLLVGILITIATAFFSVRIEKGNLLSIGTVFYGTLTFGGLISLFVLQIKDLPSTSIFIEQMLTTFLLALPVFWLIQNVESTTITSVHDRFQKIR